MNRLSETLLRALRPFRPGALLLFCLAQVVVAPPGAAAPEIGDATIDRPVAHTVFWCPIELYQVFAFVADGPEVKLEFTGRIRLPNGGGLDNRIDNVCIVEKSVFDANLVTMVYDLDAPCGQYGPEAFNFPAVAAEDLIFLEQFAAGIPPEWETSDWAHWVATSAPNNIQNPDPAPAGGSLGLGQVGDPDSLSTTSVTVTGLEAGVEYVLSFWWKCGTSPAAGELWVTIFGTPFWNEDLAGDLAINFGPTGAGWGDADGDGDEDLYLSNLNVPNQLFGNTPSGFLDVTAPPLDDVGFAQGLAWADVDNDGNLDLYLAKSGEANRLFRGTGGGRFADVTSGPLGDSGLGRGVAWGDFNRDGRVDLSIANYAGPDRLLRNDGGFSFTDVTPLPLTQSYNTTGVCWGDVDSDGDLDLFVANYGQLNQLLRNDGTTFTDITSGPLLDTGNSTGAAWGDFDNDLDLDLFVANDSNAPCRVYRNDGAGTFTNVTSGDLSVRRPVYGAAWLDGDNDGDLDLYLNIANAANRYYRNDGSAVFTRLPTDMDDPGNGRGLATADYDEDGDLDVYVCNAGGTGRLFRNDYGYGGNWLEVKLTGTTSNRSAIGARVKVTATGGSLPAGGLAQIREISGGSGYLSQSSLTAHFGLGSATRITQIQVTWPSGIVQNIGVMAVNQLIEVTEGTPGAVTYGTPPAPPLAFNVPNPFQTSTSIYYDLERETTVTLDIFDLAGRLIRNLETSALRPAGRNEVAWDGRDDLGRHVASGVYHFRIATEVKEWTGRMVVLR